MKVYTAPGKSRDTVTLMATRSTWEAILARMPARVSMRQAVSDERGVIRAALAATPGGDETVVRVTLSGAQAEQVLQLAE